MDEQHMSKRTTPVGSEELEKRIGELESLVADLEWALRQNQEAGRTLGEPRSGALTQCSTDSQVEDSAVHDGIARILVVDDEPAILDLLSEALGGTGYLVSVARDGKEALHLAYEGNFDVAVVDIRLPGMDGMDLLKQLKRYDADLSVILVTGYASVESAVQALRQGAYDYFTKPINLGQMRATVVRALERRYLLRQAAQKEVYRRLSNTDGLTGLANHRYFCRILEQETLRSKRYGHPFCVLMIDVDHFKAYNDLHGHPAGDRALRAVARTLASKVRDTDFVGRYGGEEFAIVLPETDLDGGRSMADSLLRHMDNLSVDAGTGSSGNRITISVGVSCFPEHGSDSDTLLEAADAALYKAKRTGRNRVCNA